MADDRLFAIWQDDQVTFIIIIIDYRSLSFVASTLFTTRLTLILIEVRGREDSV